ncbi:hypothetical protein DSLPV1_014 [Dishui lake phycodnavirus 1]|uniref:hypothetical protein n=1 Tax=Dishui lake phycodnavirus 1 TaxID=2079134 RepID=UPI000CD6AB93|nr:hypothetical protein C5Y57_gp014 [Dishui lake phycodnavirus 1]AUT18985.1 hypothetical protein DSLPV1_014 [Dishui lake phycodnavirus 1]
MEDAARAGDLARMKYLRWKGHGWGDAHHIAAMWGHDHVLEWIYEEARVVREREDTVPQLMRLIFKESDEFYRDRLALCMKIILERRQAKSEVVKVDRVHKLEHPNAIPIKNRT